MKKMLRVFLMINHGIVPGYIVVVWVDSLDSIMGTKGHHNTNPWNWVFALIGTIAFLVLLLSLRRIEKYLTKSEEYKIANRYDKEELVARELLATKLKKHFSKVKTNKFLERHNRPKSIGEKEYLKESKKVMTNKYNRKKKIAISTKVEKLENVETSVRSLERIFIEFKQVFLMILLGVIFFLLRRANTIDLEYFYETTFMFLSICMLEWVGHRILRYKAYSWKHILMT